MYNNLNFPGVVCLKGRMEWQKEKNMTDMFCSRRRPATRLSFASRMSLVCTRTYRVSATTGWRCSTANTSGLPAQGKRPTGSRPALYYRSFVDSMTTASTNIMILVLIFMIVTIPTSTMTTMVLTRTEIVHVTYL